MPGSADRHRLAVDGRLMFHEPLWVCGPPDQAVDCELFRPGNAAQRDGEMPGVDKRCEEERKR